MHLKQYAEISARGGRRFVPRCALVTPIYVWHQPRVPSGPSLLVLESVFCPWPSVWWPFPPAVSLCLSHWARVCSHVASATTWRKSLIPITHPHLSVDILVSVWCICKNVSLSCTAFLNQARDPSYFLFGTNFTAAPGKLPSSIPSSLSSSSHLHFHPALLFPSFLPPLLSTLLLTCCGM